jgi:hypothetical protein
MALNRFHLPVITAASVIVISGTASTQAFAFTLNPSQGQFRASDDILKVNSPWSYQGTLSTLNLNSRNNEEFCFTFFCTNRTVTASILTTTDPRSYSIEFRGNYPSAPSLRSWGVDKLADRLNNQIPSEFRDLFGLTTPITLPFAAFTQSYNLNINPNRSELTFDVGQFNCPSTVPGTTGTKTAFCRVDNVSFGGQLTAFANLQAIADTTNSIIGDERVTIRAQADRISQFLINDQLLASGDISGSTKDGKITPLNLDFLEDSKTTVDFTFKAGVKVADSKLVPEGSLEAVVRNIIPPSTNEQASASSRYLLSAFKTSDLFDAGLSRTYKVEFRDIPSLSAGIFGDSFTAASVLAQISASEPIVNYAVAATAVPVSVPEPSTTVGLIFGSSSILLLKNKRRRVARL